MRCMALLSLAVVLGCGGGESEPPEPGTDAAFTVAGVKGWYLVGNDLTPGGDRIQIEVTAPDGVGSVDAWLGGDGPHALSGSGTTFTGEIDISELGVGSYQLLLQADGAPVAFADMTIRRSHPLYVLVSNDWDDPVNHPNARLLQEELHDEHPELVMTHFVGPYLFTDPDVTQEQRETDLEWVKGMRDDYGDEIGLHIHPYCNFVDTTSVECRHEPSTVYESDPTGYTVMCAAYTTEEFTTLLEESDRLFMEAGLGKPTSFRAGGWTADMSTLLALEAAGYVADTSANNWARMEEWDGVQNGVLYEWNKESWASIDDTSQPYYPSEDDILVPGDPAVGVLEAPDNGILVDYVSTQEMIEIFEANWPDRAPLAEPVAYSTGYHPSNFNIGYKTTLTEALDHVDMFLASSGDGPVVYETLSNMVQVWKP